MTEDRSDRRVTAREAWTVLVLWAAAFGCLAYLSLVTLERLKYLYLRGREDAAWSPRQLLGAIEASDGMAALCCLALVAVLLALELRRRSITQLIDQGPAWAVAACLAIAALWGAHAILAPGLPVTGDASAHIARISHLAMAVREGSSLYWDNYFYAGGTLLQFTGPVFHWLATALTLAIGDPADATKLLVGTLRVLAALAAFALFRQLEIGQFGAFLGALAYAGSFAVAYLASVRSSFPQILHLAIFPLVLLAADKVLASARPFAWPWWLLCILAVMLIGNHQPSAVMAALLAAVFVLARMRMTRAPMARAGRFAAAALVIGACAAYFVVPFLAETAAMADRSAAAVLSASIPDLRQILTYLRPTQTGGGIGEDYTAPLGTLLLLCVAASLAAVLRPTESNRAAIWILAVGLLILVLCLKGPYVRPVVFVLLFAAMAAAVGAQAIARQFGSMATAALLALLIAETSLGALQPWLRQDFRSLVAVSHRLAERAGGQRVIEVVQDNDRPAISAGPDSSPLYYDRVASLSGPHKMDATLAHNPVAVALKLAEADLRSGSALSPTTLRALQLMNVGWILGVRRAALGLASDFIGTVEDPVLGRHFRVADATPIVASGRVRPLDPPPGLLGRPFWNDSFEPETSAVTESSVFVRGFADAMSFDPQTRTAKTILVKQRPSEPEWAYAADVAPTVSLLEYRVAPGRVILRVRSEGQGYLRLAHPAHPSIVVTRDGTPTATGINSLHFIVVALAAGEQRYDLVASPSPLRQFCFWATVAGTGALLLGLLASLLRRHAVASPR